MIAALGLGMSCLPAQADVATNGLVSWWKFDETSDTNAVDSHGSNDGILNGFSGSPTWTTDTAGSASSGALYFDGTSDYVEVPADPSLNISNAITMEAWIKLNPDVPSNSQHCVLCKGADAYGGYAVSIRGEDNSTYLKLKGVNGSYPGCVIPTNEWIHMACTYDSAEVNNEMRLYTNGCYAGYITAPEGAVITNVSAHLIIGSSGKETDGGWRFRGTIDDVRVYNRALSRTEAALNYDAMNPSVVPPLPSGIVTDGLVSCWTFDDGNGRIAYDSAGINDNHGVLYNDCTWTNDTAGDASSGALYFDGTNDFVDVLYDASMYITNALTMEAWVKGTSWAGDHNCIMNKGSHYTNGYVFTIRTGDSYIKMKGVQGGYVAPLYIPTNEWVHMVYTYDSAFENNGMQLYTNGCWAGVVHNNDNTGIHIINDLANLTIGCQGGSSYTARHWDFYGAMDDVKIYNKALTLAEIQQNYCAVLPRGMVFIVK